MFFFKSYFRVYLISEAELSQIKSLFDIDKEISVTRIKTDKGELFSTDPPVCYKCFEERCREEEKEQLIAEIAAKDKKIRLKLVQVGFQRVPKIKSLEMSNVEAEEVVTSNNNKIQDLENNLEETTETLNDVKSKLLLQNEVRQKDYKDYEVNLGSKNTAIKNLEVRLETFEKYLKDEVNLTKSLKQTNADLEAKLEKIMPENKIVSKTSNIQELVELNIGVKTRVGKMKDSNSKCLIIEIKLDEITKNFQDAMEVISRRNDKIKDLEESDIAAKIELEKTKQELESKRNDVKSFETQLASLKKENETIETKCRSTEETLSKYKDRTIEILRKSKGKITDTVKEVASKNNFIKHLEIQMETLKKDLKVA